MIYHTEYCYPIGARGEFVKSSFFCLADCIYIIYLFFINPEFDKISKCCLKYDLLSEGIKVSEYSKEQFISYLLINNKKI